MLQPELTHIDPSIFRAYDIRGIVGVSLTEESVYAMGRAIGTLAIQKGNKCLAVGRDGRLSGPTLLSALCKGIISTGCDVINVGMVPTPLLYYATFVLETGAGVMLTGSHNPSEYNGLKIMLGGETLAQEGIQQIYQCIVENSFLNGKGELVEVDIVERYLRRVTQDVKLNRPLKVVVDCGSGVAGVVAPELFRKLGCEVHELFCEVDGTFPNHHPDPSQVENLTDLIQQVRDLKADIGLAFDGDGDRLGVVTNQGDIIWPDRQLMLLAKALLSERPGSKIIYDVKCSYHLDRVIREAGGEPIMWKTGHSLVKSKLVETRAALAGEMSGHIFYKDRWFGFDDALYAGARLLQVIAAQDCDVHTLFETIPNSVNTPEIKVYVTEDEKFPLMQALVEQSDFSPAELITIDGLRASFPDGWGLVRPSNTTPCLVLRFEAENDIVLEKIKGIFRQNLLAAKADLEIPF